MRVVGKPLPKVDAAAKVTGRAVYADDMLPARTLHCKILRSPHPHARIRSIDASAARRIPGVLAVITGADLPVRFGILPVTQDERTFSCSSARSSWATGRMPNLTGRSAPVITARTPGIRRAADASIERIRACG